MITFGTDRVHNEGLTLAAAPNVMKRQSQINGLCAYKEMGLTPKETTLFKKQTKKTSRKLHSPSYMAFM